jgi:hypothetical protein
VAESIADSPQLNKLWDANRNGAATSVLVRSYRSAWWLCENGHSFQRSPRQMLSNSSCPNCSRGPSVNSVAKARPSLVPLWNTDKMVRSFESVILGGSARYLRQLREVCSCSEAFLSSGKGSVYFRALPCQAADLR